MSNAAMPSTDITQSATELVDRYLDAWTEPEAEARLTMVRRCWAHDGALVEPPSDGRGRASVSGVMAALQATHPNHRFVRTTAVDAHHDTFRVGWELRNEEDVAVLSGTDFGVHDGDGRLTRVSGFFAGLTEIGGEAA